MKTSVPILLFKICSMYGEVSLTLDIEMFVAINSVYIERNNA